MEMCSPVSKHEWSWTARTLSFNFGWLRLIMKEGRPPSNSAFLAKSLASFFFFLRSSLVISPLDPLESIICKRCQRKFAKSSVRFIKSRKRLPFVSCSVLCLLASIISS